VLTKYFERGLLEAEESVLTADFPTQIVFGLTSLLVLVSALMVVVNRHPVYSALFLVLTFIGLSVFFLQLQAPFLAAVQVIVYAGAIMVLFLFVIMLLGEDKPLPGLSKLGPQVPLGIGIALLLVGILSYSIWKQPALANSNRPARVALIRSEKQAPDPAKDTAEFGSVKAIGNTLFTQYLFAFEATSIVLLVAMIGVVVLAKKRL